MFACLDVHYAEALAHAAAVVFHAWEDDRPASHVTATSAAEHEYTPGEFYKRELGPLQGLLGALPADVHTLIIDGYCTLSEAGRPGLGAHLYNALDQRLRIVGVAKTCFRSAPAIEVLRGASARPLYVTALGIPAAEAAAGVARMHGAYRVPTLLKAVDTLARNAALPAAR
jgi:deoxyribonuclease V